MHQCTHMHTQQRHVLKDAKGLHHTQQASRLELPYEQHQGLAATAHKSLRETTGAQ